MQIFIPYSSPIEVAKSLDKRRLHKQVLEGNWYIVNGEKLIYRNGKLINRENI